MLEVSEASSTRGGGVGEERDASRVEVEGGELRVGEGELGEGAAAGSVADAEWVELTGKVGMGVGIGSDATTTSSVFFSKLANTLSTSWTNFLLSFLTTSCPPLSSPSASMRSFSRWWARTVGVEFEVGEERRE